MSRLTYRNNLGQSYLEYGADAIWQKCEAYDVLTNAIEKLAHYEDLEEQGRLIEQKHGRWIPNKIMLRTPYATNYHCSECGYGGNGTTYCPNCGAKMDEVE